MKLVYLSPHMFPFNFQHGLCTATDTVSGSGFGAILPTWTAVDASNVKTSRELWENMKKEGWNVDYFRIPISPDRPIEVCFSIHFTTHHLTGTKYHLFT